MNRRRPREAETEAPTSGAWVFCGRRRLALTDVDWFEPPARLPAPAAAAHQIAAALDEPLAAALLAQLAGEARRVAITVPDLSRPCPVADVLPPLVVRLAAADVRAEDITVVVGCGLHRSTTAAEKIALVGSSIADLLRIVDAQGLEQVNVDRGMTGDGTPILINEHIAAADLVITIGVVEPHLYAGFSGGVKGVSIGCAGEPTIAHTHRPAFIDQAGVVLGSLDGNPFQETLREIAARTNLRYAVNLVMNEEGEPAQVMAGDPEAVQRALAAAYRRAWLRPLRQRFDVLVAGIHAPKSESLYQASRAATYAGLADQPAIADGGLIILSADLPKAAGDGPGERNFAAVLAAAPAEIIARGLREPLGPGGQRAFVVAKVLRRFRLAVYGCEEPTFLAPLGITAVPDLTAALAAEAARLGRRPRVLAVADAMATVVHRA
ncbi:MAG: lactate racemase domain-containing protein [Thermoleophilia bacterium]